MRRFVAVPIPAEVRDRVEQEVAPLRPRHPAWRWTAPSSWHLTLAFVADLPDALLDDTVALLREEAAGGFAPSRLGLASAGRFGDRVLWIGIADEPSGALRSLGEAIQQGLAARGVAVDRKPVRPHLTLARAGAERIPRSAVDEVAVPAADWIPDRLELMTSHLQGPRPARYEVDASVPLPS